MNCNHINPETWRRAVQEDGKERAYCRGCGKFMGYTQPIGYSNKPAKPEKAK